MRRGSRRVASGLRVLAFGLTLTAAAHRLDELLQSTLVAVGPDHLHLDVQLTPGVAVAPGWVDALDVDRDGIVSPSEAVAHARRLAGDLAVALDGQSLPVGVVSAVAAPVADLRAGVGGLQATLEARFRPMLPGPHAVRVENRHLPEGSVHLVNAVQPTASWIQVLAQRRNETQSDFQMDLVVSSPTGSRREGPRTSWGWILKAGAVGGILAGALGAVSRRRRARRRSESGAASG